ncbi:voltage-gated potassium channel [Aureococcus anophagefferens]|nr:voltage-gated potassium channel [Aureococcus anophagefferens]
MKRPQFRIKIPQVAKRIKNFAAKLLPMAMNAASLGHEINEAERAAPAGEPPLAVYAAPEIVLPPVAQVPPVPIEAPEAPGAPEGEPKLHPLVAALKKSCSENKGECARGRDVSMLNFVPHAEDRRVKFDAAVAAYVAAGALRNSTSRTKALAQARSALYKAASKHCIVCRDVQWLRRTDPTKEAKLRKDLLAVWRRKHLGTNAGNAHLKKKRKGGTTTSGPSEVQAFVDVADMFREVLDCTPKCAYCHRVDTTAEQRAQAAAEDLRRATVPEGESKAERKSRVNAILLRKNRVDKQDYINGLKREIGRCEGASCDVPGGRLVVEGKESGHHMAHLVGHEKFEYRDSGGEGMARLASDSASLKTRKPLIDKERTHCRLLCANCPKIYDTTPTLRSAGSPRLPPGVLPLPLDGPRRRNNMSGYTDLDAPPRRGVHRVVGFGAGAALLFLGFAASRNEWHFLEEELKEKRGMHAAAAEATTSVVTLNSTDFTAIDAVCEHVAKMENVGDCRDLDDDTLWRYVPRKMELEVDRNLVEGSIGSVALGGYVAFNMVWQDTTGDFASSWFVVVSYAGEIKTMPWSESEFVFAAGKNTLLKGYAFKVDWRTGAYERLTDVEINTHDVQKGYQGNAFWSALPSEEFQETCVDLGTACPKSSAMRISGVPRADVQDLNHIQALEDDAYLLISSRMTNTLYYVHAGNGSKIWALGGDDGDFGHNAEFIGKSQYALMNNNFDTKKNSKLLIVEFAPDSDDANATVVWEYDTGAYSQNFGDNDRLPTGNMLACWWPSETINGSDAYEARVAEIARDSMETAFRLDIYGKKTCADGETCARGTGWLMYSASQYEGFFNITDDKDAELATGRFSFAPHWRATAVHAKLAATSKTGTIYVENQFGSNATATYDCRQDKP